MGMCPLVVTEVSSQGVLDNGVDRKNLYLSPPVAVGIMEIFPQTPLYFQVSYDVIKTGLWRGELEYPVWFQLYFYGPHDINNVPSLLFPFNILK